LCALSLCGIYCVHTVGPRDELYRVRQKMHLAPYPGSRARRYWVLEERNDLETSSAVLSGVPLHSGLQQIPAQGFPVLMVVSLKFNRI